MLESEVQEFCFTHNMGDLLNEVLKDNSKLFDTEYAQPLIIATQLVETAKYKKLQLEDIEYVYAGFSLGEITALIASGAISVKEGLNFARQRGKITKQFSENELQSNRNADNTKRIFGVARIPYYEGLENQLLAFNSSQEPLDKINITNYIPNKNGKSFVTITGELNSLGKHIELFGGRRDQTIVTMQCPFHTIVLSDLIPKQKRQFDFCITTLDTEAIRRVYSTRTCEFYSSSSTKESVNSSLGEYLIQPMQQAKTMDFFRRNYLDSQIIVCRGEAFAKQIARQYESVGGNINQVSFIQDEIKRLTNEMECLNSHDTPNI